MKTIKELRIEQGLTQLALAVVLGVTPSTVYMWERGRHKPRVEQLRALAKVFGVPMDSIDLDQAGDIEKESS